VRLTTLSLRQYGNFESEDITFDAHPRKINLLVAPNGAGKSVLRTAFCDLLFGISGQTPMGFRFGYSGMRVSADAITQDGERFTFGRRKGQGNTLVDGEGNTLDPVTLARLLGRTDRTMLERLFALDTPKLREGEEQLLATNGALAAALVSGAGGVRDAERLRESLEAARDALAPMRRSSQRPFYVELEKYAAARRQLNNSLLKPDQWETLDRERQEARRQQEDENKRADTASVEIARLERVRRVAPWLAVHDDATAWLAAHPDAPLLDSELATRLAGTRAAIVRTQERANRDTAQAAELALQLESIVPDTELLAVSADIDLLVDTAGAARKAAADVPGVQSELDGRHRRITTLLQELGSPLPVTEAAKAVPPRAVVGRARRLITGWRQQTVAMNASRRQIAELTRNLAEIDAELAALPPVADTQALESLVQEIRADGDPARRRRALAAESEEAEIAVSDALAHVPGWTAGTKALLDFAPLEVTAYDRIAADWAATRAEEQNRRRQAEEARQALARVEERLAAIAKPGAIVSEDDLNAARAHRDDGWHLIYRQAFTADPPSVEEQSQFARELPLPLAFERAVAATDAMADSRMRDHAVVIETELHSRAVATAQATLTEAQETHRLVQEPLEAAARAWRSACSGLPLGDMPAVSDVHSFLAARERVIEAVRRRTGTENALRGLDAQHSIWVSDLAASLDLHPGEVATLARLLLAADQTLGRARDAAAARTRVADRRHTAAEALANEKGEIAAATAETADWTEKWRGLLAELSRPPGEEPEATDEVLQLLGDLTLEHQAAEALVSRLAGMNADHHRFRSASDALVASVAPDLQALSPFEAVAGISQRLAHQRGLEQRHSLLSAQLVSARESAAKAEQDLADHQATLAAILSLIGADSVEAAETRLALSAERGQKEARLADAQARLRELGHGPSMEQLRDELAAVAFDDIEAAIERASRDRKEANERAQAAAAQFARLAQQMERDAAATTASVAAMQQQSAAAAMGRVLEEALLLHVASALLEKSLASVEATGAPALLQRISELFQALTNDLYRVYTVADVESRPRLVLQERRFPNERKEVRDLSDGTRDQLFLALRLAAIEEHAATAPPLPFIGDDILQTFDDDRSLSTLRVLLTLSEKVQVILLTHHRHLLDVAARLPSDAVHICVLKELIPA
jgi:uncharacterized protein YhaN